MKLYSACFFVDGKSFNAMYMVKKCKYGFKIKWDFSEKLYDYKNKSELVQQVKTEKEAIKEFTNLRFLAENVSFVIISEIKI